MIIKNIQLLRGIAANSVLLFHMTVMESRYGNGMQVIPNPLRFLESGVDLFFVISGFIMAIIISADSSWKEFLFARIARIYPAYWIYTTVALLVFIAVPTAYGRDQMPSIWKSYLLIPQRDVPLLNVGWTLIHEVYFYLILAILLAARIPLWVGIALWAPCIILLYLLTDSTASPILKILSHPLGWEFIMGAMAGFLIKAKRLYCPRTILSLSIFAILVAAFIVPYPSASAPWLRALVVGSAFTLLVYGLSAIKEVKNCGLFMKLGDASYSLYLSHVLVISLIGKVFLSLHTTSYALEVIYVVFSIVMANAFGLISYALLETQAAKFMCHIRRYVCR